MIAAALGRNLRAGARLAFFLPVRSFDFRVSALDFTALLAFNCLLWVLVAGVRAGFQGELDYSALLVYLATVPLVLAAAMLVALAYGMPQGLLAVAVALSASDAVFELAGLAVPYVAALAGIGAPAYFVFFGWIWVVAVRAVAVSAGTRRPQLYLGAAAVSAMMAIALFVFPQVDVWTAPEGEEQAAPLADERLFHLQGELIGRALASIQPGRPGVREHFFVGFAPDASQDVFLREMRYVKRLFDERFGTAGRSIALASSYDALEELPIASGTNLARALERIGKAMNSDEDVLVLFISAHGDREHRLSAWQPPLELAPLTPTALARMLHDAGIKWRVVVVSACYSGGFIEPLRDDNSIVITAAAPDRTSFGCEAGRDFTYFGQAYFRDALAKTTSFTEAFEIARRLVSEQEAAEGLQASLPQIWVGRAIGELLRPR
jgi:peptidase C13-like protein